MLYTGLDLHRSFSYITTMNDKGEIIGQKKLPSNGEVVEFLKEFDDTMEVAIEQAALLTYFAGFAGVELSEYCDVDPVWTEHIRQNIETFRAAYLKD